MCTAVTAFYLLMTPHHIPTGERVMQRFRSRYTV